MSRESGISKPAALIGRVVVSPTLWKSYVEKLRRERKKRGQTHMLLTGPPPDARNGGFDWPSSKAEKSRCSERHAARHPCKPTMDGVQQRGTAPCVFQRFPFISYLFIYLFFGARGAFELCAEFTAKSRRWNGSGRRGGGGGGRKTAPIHVRLFLDGFWANGMPRTRIDPISGTRHRLKQPQTPSAATWNSRRPCGGNGVACG